MLDRAKLDSNILLSTNDRVVANPERQGYSFIKSKKVLKFIFSTFYF